MNSMFRALFAVTLALAGQKALAQSLPVTVDIAGEIVHATVGAAADPLAELILTFDDASGLSASSLGISAQLVDPQDVNLLSRLPDITHTGIPSAFAALITIEPPLLGGLSFHRVVTVEIHTELLEYTAGSQWRVFKAPLNGNFRDITREVLPGSVRARSGTGSFSQFIIVADLRPSSVVIDKKLAWLSAQVAALEVSDREQLEPKLQAITDAVAEGRFDDANAALDLFSAYVSANAGVSIPEQWAATRNKHNAAGELLSGAATLKFSIAFLRDYGF